MLLLSLTCSLVEEKYMVDLLLSCSGAPSPISLGRVDPNHTFRKTPAGQRLIHDGIPVAPAAEGLDLSVAPPIQEYLRFFCEPPVYNVFISSNNIFLDENLVAELSDVGFADCELICNGESNITSEDTSEQRHRRFVFHLITGQSLLIEAEIESEFSYSIHKIVDADLGEHYDSKELGSWLVMVSAGTNRTFCFASVARPR